MTTYSQLVDELVLEVRRPDMVVDIARYCNETIRELHFDPKNNAALFYRENFREALILAASEASLTWTIPFPSLFQKMAAVKYLNQWGSGAQVYATETMPGRPLNGMKWYYYQAGDSFVFSDFGGANAQVALGYYEFPRPLQYKVPAARLVVWDPD